MLSEGLRLRGRCVRALLALLAASLGLAAADFDATAGEVALPGDPDYWVKLHYLEVSDGHLDPAFTEDGNHFTVVVPNPDIQVMYMSLGLDLRKYNPMYCPRIYIDDSEFPYSPLDALSVEVMLNRTIGPVDKVMHIKLVDPSENSGPFHVFSSLNSHTYTIHVLQPPEFQRVVQAQDIRVTDMEGNAVKGAPRFDPETMRYVYRLPSAMSQVRLKIECSEYATDVRIDGKEVAAGESRIISVMENHATIMAECEYTHERWAPQRMTKSYEVRFEKEIHLGPEKVNLVVMPEQGVCELAQHKLHSGVHAEGFTCRMDVDAATFIVLYNQTDAEALLIHDETGEQTWMTRGIPSNMLIAGGTQRYTLRLETGGGLERHDYPVVLIHAAQCSSLKCPRDMHLRADVTSHEFAGARLCLGDTCSEKDVAHCCENRARCSSFDFSCNKHQKLRADAADVMCEAGACREGEKALCCEDVVAKCSSMGSCPDHTHLRGDAENVSCASWECGEEDVETCCQAEEPARCDKYTFGCPEHQELRLDAERVKCKKDVCSIADQDACCAQVSDSILSHSRAEERVTFYKDIGCAPTPGNYCTVYKEKCYYDSTCQDDHPRNGGLGCWAGGVHQRCRFCGFGIYEDCPVSYDCADPHCEAWSPEHMSWCVEHYGVFCYRAQINDIVGDALPKEGKDEPKHQAVYTKVMRKFALRAGDAAQAAHARAGLVVPVASLAAFGVLLAAAAFRWGSRAPRERGYTSFPLEQQASLA